MMEIENQPGRSFLRIRAGGVVYGVPVDRVRRVVAAMQLYEVPGGPPNLFLGRFGGEPLAVLAIGPGDGPFNWKDEQQVVVVQSGPLEKLETVGLAVERSLDVVTMHSSAESGGGEPHQVDATSMILLDPETLGPECTTKT